jgi:hypothetical protein
MTKFPNSPNCQMNTGSKNLRHPERSEANDLFVPSSLTRAQSKDLVALSCDDRTGTNSLYAGPVRRLGKVMPSPTPIPTDCATRSFDFGSATPSCKTRIALAFAQDDGILKPPLSFRAPRRLNLKPVGYPLN